MSIDRARDYLKNYDLDEKILEFDQSSATVELAAQAVGTEPCRICKSLSFLLPEGPILVLTAGDVKVNNGKFKRAFGTKPKMIPAAQVEELIGHDIGGVCPFGINEGVRVFLDESLKKYETVYPAAGSSNSAIELKPDKLFYVSQAEQWVDVTK